MANGESGSTNGKFLGLSPAMWETLVNKVGFPVLSLIVVVYLVGWKFGPSLVEGHLNFLKTTSEAVEKSAESQTKLNDSMKKINESVSKVIESETVTKDFQDKVETDHQRQIKGIEEVSECVEELTTSIDENTKAVSDTLEEIRKQRAPQ
jgi:predicted PurR-regulated permease PerM